MKLSVFIKKLKELEDQGHGNLEVFYSHGASGDCGELSNPSVTDYIDPQTGPFDLESGEEYISVYAGH